MNGDWATLTSSKKNDHPTPQWLFDELHREFSFDIDLCASDENAKLALYIDAKQDFLQEWMNMPVFKAAFMNPPYQKREKACIGGCQKKTCQKRGYHLTQYQPGTEDFVKAAYQYSQRGATVVCLLKSSTGNDWFHEYAMPYGEIRFLKGRLKFEGSKDPAPFDSVIVIFRGMNHD